MARSYLVVITTYHAAGVIRNDEIRLYVVVFQVGVALATMAWFHLIVVAEALESLLRDVDPSVKREFVCSTRKIFLSCIE